MFGMMRAKRGIEHRLATSDRPGGDGQIERMSRTLKEATVERDYHEAHDRLQARLKASVGAGTFVNYHKTFRGPTPHGFICKAWTKFFQFFRIDPLPSDHRTEHMGFQEPQRGADG
ncbi:MAG: hypothetical protein IT564_06790 [Rhodospirillales bacterium]|nr:hypothetical protein [Rhodospirillales bacterium]